MAPSSTWPIAVALLCALAGALGQLFFKTGSTTVGLTLTSWLTNWRIILGFVLYGSSALGFILALKNGKLSILYPIIATSYIWVTIFSAYFLKESINIYHWIGISLILSGIFIIVKGGATL